MTAGGNLIFVDTNLLLYTLDSTDLDKQRAALRWRDALWESAAGRLSWQVLNEFYSNATGKLRAPHRTVRQTVEEYCYWQPVGFGPGILRRAWYWMDRAGIPYWDSLIVAAAETAGCAYLLSEDFQEGRSFDQVTVLHPFHTRPGDFL